MSEAKDLLNLRLAKGEISLEQYQSLLAAISETPSSPITVGALEGPLQPTTSPQPVTPAKVSWWKVGSWAIGALAAFGVLRAIFGGPVCDLSNLTATADAYMINGQLDAGFTTIVDVTNTGGGRNLIMSALLTTSEGDFRRAQNLFFEAGQSRRVTFQFHEPTVGATGIKTYVTCSL